MSKEISITSSGGTWYNDYSSYLCRVISAEMECVNDIDQIPTYLVIYCPPAPSPPSPHVIYWIADFLVEMRLPGKWFSIYECGGSWHPPREEPLRVPMGIE